MLSCNFSVIDLLLRLFSRKVSGGGCWFSHLWTGGYQWGFHALAAGPSCTFWGIGALCLVLQSKITIRPGASHKASDCREPGKYRTKQNIRSMEFPRPLLTKIVCTPGHWDRSIHPRGLTVSFLVILPLSCCVNQFCSGLIQFTQWKSLDQWSVAGLLLWLSITFGYSVSVEPVVDIVVHQAGE